MKKKILLLLFVVGCVFTLLLSAWDGYFLLFDWILLQIPLFTIWCWVPKNNDWNSFVDVSLVTVIVALLSILSGSTLLSFISENLNSRIAIIDNLLTIDETKSIIMASEKEAMRRGSWETKRHRNYPTTDLAAYTINQTIQLDLDHTYPFSQWLNRTVDDRILPLLAEYYNINIKLLSVKDLFIVKYDAERNGSQRRLKIHQDSSLLSFNIALSQYEPHWRAQGTQSSASVLSHESLLTSFTGGGTYVCLANKVLQIKQGALLMHPSRLYHAGAEINHGVRYILVGFVNVDIYSFTTIWRRWGSLSRCVNIEHRTSQSTMQSSVIMDPTGELSRRLYDEDSSLASPISAHSFPSAIFKVSTHTSSSIVQSVNHDICQSQAQAHVQHHAHSLTQSSGLGAYQAYEWRACRPWGHVIYFHIHRFYNDTFSPAHQSQDKDADFLRVLVYLLIGVFLACCAVTASYSCLICYDWYSSTQHEISSDVETKAN